MRTPTVFSLLIIAASCLAFLAPNAASVSVNQAVTTFAPTPVDTITYTNTNSTVTTNTDFGQGSLTTIDMSYSTTTFVMTPGVMPCSMVQVIQFTATSGQLISGYEPLPQNSSQDGVWYRIYSQPGYATFQNSDCGANLPSSYDPALTSSIANCNVLVSCGPYSSVFAPSDGTYYYVFWNSEPSATVTFVGGLSTNGGSSLDFGGTFGLAALVIVGVLVAVLMLRRRSHLPA